MSPFVGYRRPSTFLASSMVILHHIDPLKCMYRSYPVHAQPTLFDSWEVICAWGSLRTNFHQQRAVPCENRDAAECLALKIVARRERQGYERKDLQ
jgi:predicted DNA-binding WGR domain protein